MEGMKGREKSGGRKDRDGSRQAGKTRARDSGSNIHVRTCVLATHEAFLLLHSASNYTSSSLARTMHTYAPR